MTPVSERQIDLSTCRQHDYEEQGFVVVRRLFAPAKVRQALDEAIALLDRHDLISTRNLRCRWQTNVRTNECQFETFDPVIDLSPACRTLAEDGRLLDVLAGLYGEPACLFKDKLIYKPPGCPGYGLHQDWIAWPGFPRSFLTVLAPLDATTTANGCTVVYPGYHRRGSLAPEDGQYHPLPAGTVDESLAVPLELEPGDVAIFTGFTPHRSDPNVSDDWRRQLFLSYNKRTDGGNQRQAHYAEFHRWLRRRYAEHGKPDVYFELPRPRGSIMTATLTMAPIQAVRFHLSLNVADLGRSLAFYRILFGIEPAKLRADYAKFELDDPPLVLSLEPTPRASGGPLNHLGFRMPDAASLVAMQERLERAGIRSQREEGVECCYARQTKFWVHDPDRTLWEVYTLDGDIDHRGAGQLPEKVQPAPLAAAAGPRAEPVVWEHRLGQRVPERAPFADGSVDEVRLRGSLNVPLNEGERTRLLAEARRVLRAGGRLFVHVLCAERPFAGEPGLPGPAAAVRYVPVDADVVALVEGAGFESARLLKFDARPCFVREGVPLRETQLEGWKPTENASPSVAVVYKGPFREIRDDVGNVFPRGRRVLIDETTAARLRSPEWAAQFLVLG